MIKLIATDMDGTWLNSKKEYDLDKFKQIMDLAREKGVKFVIASGNQYENLVTRFPKEYLSQLYFVAENGAYVLKGREILNIVDLNSDELATIHEIKEKYGQDHPTVLAGVNSAYTLQSYGEEFYNYLHLFYQELKAVDDYESVKDRIFKFTVATGEGESSAFAQQLKREFPSLDMVAGSDSAVDISKLGMNKAVGLKLLGKRYGGNDVAMLQYVGQSYATATALPEAKRAANGIIGSSDESAVQDKVLDLLKKL
ncbi:Cof-type HAD-IIB family hydrolase [Lactobacillus delbrueckii subsp. lactis]|uniref:HAD family phosphatase n=1 Tax=Lactobacillus leichmannii TaxID=28039 RepID=A0ABT1XWI9_LACLE|nr:MULTISPECIES: HAD family hydrolase [Lactobacillus]APG67922.1 HAD family hydrolase [Lactobacillus delbrueckii subsp. lactis]MCD5490282.1 Cof-type HAD-IIB family hydrolase [Lactobacillus delbrueckii subsp. lactis]MCD5495751.1 Cof-type HAD-IIB family hydrolase [Lactobacillus delbrueckii subsp. lactis]MCD5497302.1 Cof-type HAD-IIB family hydrolase [Lactobacillus delbrueckii subsp. lactis]MCD5499265.1 Cof-type HAD-IIB family hydrolase [Lactobacillus delbrueckii subsp. lactis]